MALTIGESIAVQRITGWLAGLTMFERDEAADALPGEEDADLIGAVTLLAAAARKTLAAGPSGDEAAALVRAAIGTEGGR